MNPQALKSLFSSLALLAGALICIGASTPAAAQESSITLTPKARLMSGKLYLGQKLYEKAEEQVRMAVQGDSTNAEFRAWWGVTLCELAHERLRRTAAISDVPRRLQAIRDLLPLYDNAHRQFMRAIQLDPVTQVTFSRNSQTHYWVSIFKQAEGLFNTRSYEEGLEFFRLLTTLDPEDSQGHLYEAYSLDKLGRVREGVVAAGRALEASRIGIEAVCDTVQDPQRRNDCFRRKKQDEMVRRSVSGFIRSRNFSLANEAFDASMATDSLDVRRDRLREAISLYENLLLVEPDVNTVRFNLGNAWFALAQTYGEPPDTAASNPGFRKAADLYLQVARVDSVKVQLRDDAFYNAMNAFYSAGDWARLLPLLKSRVASAPRDAGLYRRVAECLAELKRPQETLSYLMMANALSEKGREMPVEGSLQLVRELGAEPDAAADLKELGSPESTYSYQEPESSRLIITWCWWSKGLVRHYIAGRRVGSLTIGGGGAQ